MTRFRGSDEEGRWRLTVSCLLLWGGLDSQVPMPRRLGFQTPSSHSTPSSHAPNARLRVRLQPPPYQPTPRRTRPAVARPSSRCPPSRGALAAGRARKKWDDYHDGRQKALTATAPPASTATRIQPPWGKYYHKTFALNQLYASKHGLDLLLVRPTQGEWLKANAASPRDGLCPAWCRIKILANQIVRVLRNNRQGGGGAHWIVYIDSDAYVREQHVKFLPAYSSQQQRLQSATTPLSDSPPLQSDLHQQSIYCISREQTPARTERH